MLYQQLNQASAKPELWSVYNADQLWTTPHLAKQMLAFHLNGDIPLASRSFQFMDSSVAWLIAQLELNQHSRTIDFGCAVGHYCQRLKTAGIGTVVGLDFSKSSIDYAKQQADKQQLDIEYHLGNYLDFHDPRQFDLITLVMCDLCALSPQQRSQLFAKFKSLLTKHGAIALDVYTAERFAGLTESVSIGQNSMNGFWSSNDYWCIQANHLYPEQLVSLDKYTICQHQHQQVVYNWLQHFTLESLSDELAVHGLVIEHHFSDLCGTPYAGGDELAVIIRHA